MNPIELAHRVKILQQLSTVREIREPEGWRLVVEMAVGGLLYIGFDEHSENLLVVSSTGRSIVDCTTGEKIARNYEPPDEWLDEINLWCEGIGSMEKRKIRIAGISGGGLVSITEQGDSLCLVAPDYPRWDIIFEPHRTSVFLERDIAFCRRICSEYTIRAYGFSSTGRTMVVATSSNLMVWTAQT